MGTQFKSNDILLNREQSLVIGAAFANVVERYYLRASTFKEECATLGKGAAGIDLISKILRQKEHTSALRGSFSRPITCCAWRACT